MLYYWQAKGDCMQIQWSRKALKQLLKLKNKLIQKQIKDAVANQLPSFRQSSNVLPLNNHQYQYRLKVGRYRVFFNCLEDIQVVAIEEVKKRDERTY